MVHAWWRAQRHALAKANHYALAALLGGKVLDLGKG